MDAVAVIARLLLAGVFAVSGVAKLLDRDGTRRAVKGFGLPDALVGPVAALLPVAECVTAAGLLPGTSARPSAMAAMGLLTAFVVGIAVNLARGRRPDCHCFGQIHSAPAGPATLVRNLVLGGLAATVALSAGTDAGGSIRDAVADLDGVGVVLVIVALVGAGATLYALRWRRPETMSGAPSAAADDRPAGPPIGAVAPAFALATSSGGSVTLEDVLRRGRRALLVFFSPSCGSCVRLAPELARWQKELRERLTVAVLSAGSPERVRASAAEYGIGEILLDEGGTVATSYGSRGTPGAVLINADGSVASTYAVGEGAIGDLVIDAFGLTELVAAAGVDQESRAPDDGDKHVADGPAPAGLDPSSIDEGYVPRSRHDVAITEKDGDTVLVDPASGTVHVLNSTAAIVWRCLDGTGTISDITRDLAEAFAREASEIRPEVLEVVRRFARQGLLDGVAPEAAPAQHAH